MGVDFIFVKWDTMASIHAKVVPAQGSSYSQPLKPKITNSLQVLSNVVFYFFDVMFSYP